MSSEVLSKSKKIIKHILVFPGIILLGIFPILIAMLAGLITQLFGQTLNEGNPPDIPIIGGILYSMGVMGWFAMLTIPCALIALVIYFFYFIVRVVQIAGEKPDQQ